MGKSVDLNVLVGIIAILIVAFTSITPPQWNPGPHMCNSKYDTFPPARPLEQARDSTTVEYTGAYDIPPHYQRIRANVTISQRGGRKLDVAMDAHLTGRGGSKGVFMFQWTLAPDNLNVSVSTPMGSIESTLPMIFPDKTLCRSINLATMTAMNYTRITTSWSEGDNYAVGLFVNFSTMSIRAYKYEGSGWGYAIEILDLSPLGQVHVVSADPGAYITPDIIESILLNATPKDQNTFLCALDLKHHPILETLIRAGNGYEINGKEVAPTEVVEAIASTITAKAASPWEQIYMAVAFVHREEFLKTIINMGSSPRAMDEILKSGYCTDRERVGVFISVLKALGIRAEQYTLVGYSGRIPCAYITDYNTIAMPQFNILPINYDPINNTTGLVPLSGIREWLSALDISKDRAESSPFRDLMGHWEIHPYTPPTHEMSQTNNPLFIFFYAFLLGFALASLALGTWARRYAGREGFSRACRGVSISGGITLALWAVGGYYWHVWEYTPLALMGTVMIAVPLAVTTGLVLLALALRFMYQRR